MHRKAVGRLNAERVEQGEVTYANPRNFSAGTIKMQNSGEVARRPLDCFLYFLLGPQLPYKTHEESMEQLREWGFHVSPHVRRCDTITDALAFIHEYEKKRYYMSFDLDGKIGSSNVSPPVTQTHPDSISL